MSLMESYVSHFRPDIDRISGYVPGEQPKENGIIKLNTNESPYPPAPGVEKILREFDSAKLRLYPDPVSQDLRAEISANCGVSIENVIAGNGSDDILTIITRCFADATRPIACFHPSYSLYPTLAELQGAPCVKINLTENFDIPDDVLKQAAGANIFMIARPNAPTGNLFAMEKMEKICAEFNGIVLIDEAYADFSKDNCIGFVKRFPNVIICRTFSKSRSLAGLRFGYAIAHEKVIEGMMKMKDSYNVSMLTQKLALASLWDKRYFEDAVVKIKASREALMLGLTEQKFSVVPSETNFVFAAPPDRNGKRYFLELKRHNILVRYFPDCRTCEYVRITIGLPGDMAGLLSITKGIYGS